MKLTGENFYIIKQSKGTIWEFSYKENEGIIYRVLKENVWSDYEILDDRGTKNFSVAVFSDDSIYVLYQDINGCINYILYDGYKWTSVVILENQEKNKDDVYFQTVVNGNEIHIIYSIVDKLTESVRILHQILDKENNLSNAEVIDVIKFYYETPFVVYMEDNKNIFILYCRLEDYHYIGYKMYNNENKCWSNFFKIDANNYPYRDYSMIMIKDKLHVIYIKERENANNLIYCYGNNINFKYNRLLEDKNIDCCSLFIIYGEIWCYWISGDKIYSRFSIDTGNNFTSPPYVETLTNPNIIKAIYKSNNINDVKYLGINEVYIVNEDNPKFLVIPNIYPNIYKENNYIDSAYAIYFMGKIYERILLYEKKLKEKEKIIDELKCFNSEIKLDSIPYKERIYKINNVYNEINKERKFLNKNISFLQSNLITKEEKINSLENMNIERESQIFNLKNDIERLNKKIEELNVVLKDNKSKKNKSFFKDIFNK